MKTVKLLTVLISIVGLFEGVVLADFIFGEPTIVPNINTSSCDGCGSISSDGLELYIASSHPYGGDDCYSDIYVTTRPTVNDPWDTPTKLGPPVNTDGPEGFPCISADGLELYFSDGWPPIMMSGCGHRPGGYGRSDLWVSKRITRDDPWGEPQNLGSNINGPQIDLCPCISRDGLSLYFHSSTHPNCLACFDLFVTKRATKNDPWGPAENLGPPINTGTNEINPFISPDNLSLYFSVGAGTYDVYVSRRASVTDPWQAPVLFDPVNSSLCDNGLIFAEGCSTLYFARSDNWDTGNISSWASTVASYDIWQVEVTPILDLNGDGVVDALDVCIMVERWHTYDSLCDIAPAPMGDGFVDIQDLTVLAEHLFEEIPVP